jgi:predicted dehydrogenase
MDNFKNVGLIECKSLVLADAYEITNHLNGFHLKKILVKQKIAEQTAQKQYPGAELVNDIHSIIEDQSIDLVIVSYPEDDDFPMVAEALKAGKQVRIL